MSHKDWLRGEIAAWRREGVVGEETAAAILKRYESGTARRSWGALIAGCFGALLTGLGVIAIFAANWDAFGRGARAAVSVAPVAICGAVAILAAKRGWTATALWEPLGILWCVATGAATCLVAQTYNLGGTLPGLILFVALLTRPVVWATRSVASMALWPWLAIAWGLASEEIVGRSWTLVAESFALLAVQLPAYVAFIRRRPPRGALVVGQLLTGLVYTVGSASLMNSVMPRIRHGEGIADVVVFWGFSAVVGLAARAFKLPVWPLIATLVASVAAMFTPFFELQYYFASLALAGAAVAYGVRNLNLSYTNIGAALLAWLVLSKFFASDVSFTLKGVVLICAGIGLTVMNVMMARTKKGRAGK